MMRCKKIVVESIHDDIIKLETSCEHNTCYKEISSDEIDGEFNEGDLLEFENGFYRVLYDETLNEKKRISDKVNRLFKKS